MPPLRSSGPVSSPSIGSGSGSGSGGSGCWLLLPLLWFSGGADECARRLRERAEAWGMAVRAQPGGADVASKPETDTDSI